MRGDRLRALRKEKNLGQPELANLLGISTSTIGMYERNKREPDDETKLRLAKFFNTSVAYLMGETDNRELIKNDEIYAAFYGGYKDLDEDDRQSVLNIINSLRKKKK